MSWARSHSPPSGFVLRGFAPTTAAGQTACDLTIRALDGDPDERLAVLHELAERGASEPDVRRVAAQISTWALPELDRDRGVATNVLTYVQSLPYRVDAQGRDDAINACAVLARGGDCKKLSVLYCALCACLGVTSRLVWIEQPRASLDHVSAQARCGGQWLWAEGTVRGARLGEPPHEAAARLGALRDGWL